MRLRPLPFRTIEKILLHNGFRIISQRGSHVKFKRDDIDEPTVVQYHSSRDVPIGTIRTVIDTSRKNRDEFANA